MVVSARDQEMGRFATPQVRNARLRFPKWTWFRFPPGMRVKREPFFVTDGFFIREVTSNHAFDQMANAWKPD
jgi:hypothetical protein